MERKSCCSAAAEKDAAGGQTEPRDLKAEIRRRYAKLATSQGGSCCGGSVETQGAQGESCCGTGAATEGAQTESCCGTSSVKTETQGESCCETSSCNVSPGYSEEELRSLPDRAVAASAGCGNPTALADLKEGETVLDLGSGGGIDVFLASRKVGATGRAIGVDMTAEMIDLARRNAAKSGLANVEFRLGEIEHLPVADASVDVVISNCVINLSTDKDAVFGEAFRVLKKGGRMLVSDIMADGLPEEVRKDFSSWARCVGGAIPLEEYTCKIKSAGFTDIEVVNGSGYSPELIKSSLTAATGIDLSKNPELRGKVEGVRISHADIRATKV